jgi:CBS domain-containing protein
MNVGQICQRNVVTIRPFDELLAAAQLMREKHIGYLVVVEPALEDGTFKPVGVITDRDLVVGVLARGADPRLLSVGDLMTREPVVAQEDWSIAEALQEMRRIGVRRLPIVGMHEQLIGVLSLDDVLDTLASELQSVAGSIRSELLVEHALRP